VNPTLKYTLGRIGLFLAVFLVLWPVDLNILVKLMIAVVFSAALSYFVLRGWREQMADRLATAAERRKADRERLRSALAGEDQESTPNRRDGSEGGPAES
jgi:hypothetical protein